MGSNNQINIGNAITGDLAAGDISIANNLEAIGDVISRGGVAMTDDANDNWVGFLSPTTLTATTIWTDNDDVISVPSRPDT